MKNKRLIVTDIFVFLSILLFCGSAISTWREQTWVSVIFMMLAAGLTISYLSTLILRSRIKYYEEKERQSEAHVERAAPDKDRQIYNELKKRMLEDQIALEIKDKLPEAIVMQNVLVPKSDGTHTEIDILALDNKGVFVIEAKNLNAQIEGSWKEQELQAIYPNNAQHKLYNPIIQNQKHCTYLRNVLDEHDECLRNIVVFGQFTRFVFTDVPFNAQICKVESLMKAMERLAKRFPCEIESYKIEKWHENLKDASKKIKESQMN